MEKILIVEDDNDINQLLSKILEKKGYETTSAYSGTEARLCLSLSSYDLVIIDLMLPGIPGEELLEHIREKSNVPVIVLTAKTSLDDKVHLLKSGADDYMTKPFARDEILARVEAQLRRYKTYSLPPVHETVYVYKDLKIDGDARSAVIGQMPLHLTIYEFDILLLLVKNPSRVYSKNALYQEVWHGNYLGEDNTINVHISNIRSKIGKIRGDEEYIKTVWGIGFKMA
ncbi:response regulator transcription factor [uncultured Robinsoniella sp.]|uniref:response regulator transcription factor n=1 Tax=uncultured Robinsoniella sp. TaxID=904190 RepID=UPI00374F4CB4